MASNPPDSAHAKHRHLGRWTIAAVLVAIIVSLGIYMWRNPVDLGSPATRFSVLTADFGLRRESLTRSFDLYLCGTFYEDLHLVECTSTATVTDSGLSQDAGQRPTRPEIVSTTVGGELIEVDNNEPIGTNG